MINAEIYMISGSLDDQKSDDVFNINEFELPNPAGKAGGAFTSAFLKIMYDNPFVVVTWVWMLRKIRSQLIKFQYTQTPQLSSSRTIKPENEIFFETSGNKRALLIGINYTGQKGELFGCHNDVRNMKRFLMEKGFKENYMLILMDDGRALLPTKQNIEKAFTQMTTVCKEGDLLWVHFAGHGDFKKDHSGDEKNLSGVDSTFLPLDFRTSGSLTDDIIFQLLVKPMRRNVRVNVLTDCCHSGTLLDLPYKW